MQAIGGLLNTTWILEDRVYAGLACTTQAIIKQIGGVRKLLFFTEKTEYSHLLSSQVGTAIFTFVIGVHTFTHLFLRRKYSNRTFYIALFLAWALLFLELSIENFVLAKQKGNRPFYGIAGYWCWIAPFHPIERFTTSYLYMFVSAGCSFILYSLVFFRLRGNISVSTRYQISFHRRPKVMACTTSDGTYIMTDDRRVESHLTTLAKQMLWYPIVYTILVLPMAASRFSTFSGASVPFGVIIFTASVYMLHGFLNTVLFCTTQNILPGTWRQKYQTIKRGGVNPTSQTNDTWFTATRAGTAAAVATTATVPDIRSVGVEKDVEIKYGAEPSISRIKFGSPTSLAPLPQAYGGNGQQADLHDYHIRRFPSSAPQDTSTGICFEVDKGDEDSILSVGMLPTTVPRNVEWEVSRHPRHASRGPENGVHRPAPAPGAPSHVHPLTTTFPTNTDTPPYDVLNCRQSNSPLGKWRFWR